MLTLFKIPVTNILDLSHIYDESRHTYTLPKESPKKYINNVKHPLSSAGISSFSPQTSKFFYIKNTDIDRILIRNF